MFLAQRLGQMIGRIEKTQVPVGTLDITLYRDDLSTVGAAPVVQKTEMEFPITGKNIVLVDDVLYTGRTVRAAMDALFKQGRPRQVQLCVLIDRGHRELPIEATFVGRKVQTTRQEIIEVQLREIDDAEKVLIVEKQMPSRPGRPRPGGRAKLGRIRGRASVRSCRWAGNLFQAVALRFLGKHEQSRTRFPARH